MFLQYAKATVATASATVESTTQYLRLYLDEDESEIAPVTVRNSRRRTKRQVDRILPMRGCATSPLIGPASHTRLVTCSDMPSDSKNGVPYLGCSVEHA